MGRKLTEEPTSTYMHIHVYTQNTGGCGTIRKKSNICVFKTLEGERGERAALKTLEEILANISQIWPKPQNVRMKNSEKTPNISPGNPHQDTLASTFLEN